MTISRSSLFQFVRWILVGASIIFGLWMMWSNSMSLLEASFGWATPFLGILLLVPVAPFALIAYFGIRGEYKRFFTTVLFLLSFLIFLFALSAFHHFHFTDVINDRFSDGFFEALIGHLLLSIQFVIPFVLAIGFYRVFMRLLLKSDLV